MNANGQQASRAAQDATVTMPRGTKVLGAGGTVNGQTGRLALTAIIPAADLLSVTARGMEVGSGLTTNWSVGAYANGATPQVLSPDTIIASSMAYGGVRARRQ